MLRILARLTTTNIDSLHTWQQYPQHVTMTSNGSTQQKHTRVLAMDSHCCRLVVLYAYKADNTSMQNWEEYVKSAPNMKQIHYWDLNSTLCVGFNRPPEGLQLKTKSISIMRLLRLREISEIEDSISYIALWRCRPKFRKLRIELPLDLDNVDYVRIYALMLSEGSFRNEFRLHVPEAVFHRILFHSVRNLLGRQVSHFVHKGESKNIARTSFSPVIGHLFPIPDHIPKFILLNRDFCREYLRIAFEAEGSPVFVGSKRYIRLVRSTDVSGIAGELDMPIGGKLTFGQLRRKDGRLADMLLDSPPSMLLGEHLILLHHFNILNTIMPESIRRNKTTFRRGEFSAKWALHIYSEDLQKFAKEIGFLTRGKRSRMAEMLKMRGRKRKLFSLNNVIRHLQKDGEFQASDFVTEMRLIGYRSPRAYLSRYEKCGLIERIRRGVYRVKPDS